MEIHPTAACDTTLWSACAELKGACVGLLDAPRDALSKSFVWDKAFSIVRSHPDSDSEHNKPRVSHGGWSPDGESETLCFHAGGAHVGMLRLMAGVPESALSLEAPQGHVVADAAAYTEGRCLALLQPVNDGATPRLSGPRAWSWWTQVRSSVRALTAPGSEAGKVGTRSWTPGC